MIDPDLRPTLVLNPPGDEDFTSFARRSLNGGRIDPAELQRRLRARFPHSIVRPRGLAGERIEIWYVYRDGRWISSSPAERREPHGRDEHVEPA